MLRTRVLHITRTEVKCAYRENSKLCLFKNIDLSGVVKFYRMSSARTNDWSLMYYTFEQKSLRIIRLWRIDVKIDNYQALLNLIFLLLQESLGNTRNALLSGDQKVPQLAHERTGIPAVQKTREVDLHFSGVGKLQNT